MNDIKKYADIKSVSAAVATLLFAVCLLTGVGQRGGLGTFFVYLIYTVSAALLLVHYTVRKDDKTVFAVSLGAAAFTRFISVIFTFVNLVRYSGWGYGGYMVLQNTLSIIAGLVMIAALLVLLADVMTDGRLSRYPVRKAAVAVFAGIVALSFLGTLISVVNYGSLIRYWFLEFFASVAYLGFAASLFADAFDEELSAFLKKHVPKASNMPEGYSDTAAKLRGLKQAFDSGVLNEEEYNAKREEILKNI